jgi:hypothetical protein
MKNLIFSILVVIAALVSSCKKQDDVVPESEISSLKVEWIKTANSPSFSFASATDMATDVAGNIYIVGTADNPVVFGDIEMNDFTYGSIFLAKMDQDGKFIWVKDIARCNAPRARISIDSGNNPVIYFNYSSLPITNCLIDILPTSDNNIGIAKFTSAGLAMWSYSAGSGHNGDFPGSISIDGKDNIFITGGFHKLINFQDKTLTSKFDVNSTFIAQLGGGGECNWIQEANDNNYKKQSDFTNWGVYAVAADSKGNCYVSGVFADSIRIGGYQIFSNNTSGYIAKLNQLGHCQWITPGGITFPIFKALTVDKNDNLICGGAISKGTSIDLNSTVFSADANLLFAKLSSSNKWLWVKELVQTDHAIPEMYSTCPKIITDQANNIYFTGNSNGTTSIGNVSFNNSAKMEEMIYVARFSPDGVFNWVKANNQADAAALSEAVATDRNSNCYIAGFHNKDFSIDNEKIQEGRGVFVTKIVQP